jgi:hypothetical protein
MQLNLDFSKMRQVSTDGKKIQRIPTAVSPELKQFVETMAKMQGTSVSELTHRYIVNGLKDDIASIFIPEPHLDKSLRELLKRGA